MLTSDGSRLASVVLLLAAVVLGFHASRYLPFITDDALISLRYAQRLLEGQGLTWTDGQPVEGYSNLLWVLLSAALGALGLDLIDAVRVLGFAGGGAVLWAMVRAQGSHVEGALPWPLLFGALFFVLARPIGVWTIGGLEQPLVAALLAWSLTLSIPLMDAARPNPERIVLASLPLGLLCVTRPDGALFACATAAALSLTRGLGRESAVLAARLLSVPALCFGSQLLFRRFYYDEWVPNTARVKLGFSWERLGEGLDYLIGGLIALGPLTVLGALSLAFMLWRRPQRSAAALLLVIGIVWATYLVVIGGDIFPAFRHFVPLIVVLCWLVMYGIADFLRTRERHSIRVIALGATAAALAHFSFLQLTDTRDADAFYDGGWEWSGKVAGVLLKRAFGEEQPLFAVTAAGSLPYWSELPAVDMLGLNDHYLPRHRPQDFGIGRLAHDLGDGAYVLKRRPDLVSFCGPTGSYRACYRSGLQMQGLDEFKRSYTPVRFIGTDPHELAFIVWVNRFSPKIGIQREGDAIHIPAFLLNGNRDTLAFLNGDEQLVISISKKAPASIRDLPLRGVSWEVALSPTNPQLAAEVRKQSNGMLQLVVSTHNRLGLELEEVTLRATRPQGEEANRGPS